MSVAYTNFIQTGIAKTFVADLYGPTGAAFILDFKDSNTYSILNGNIIEIYSRIDFAGTTQEFNVSQLASPFLTLPVNITGNYNVPTYLDGTAVSANECWPYYQNTASTTDGWDANSTAQFEPFQAAFYAANNGFGDWYKCLQSNVSNSGAPSGTTSITYFADYKLQIVANADTKIQTMAFFTSSLNSNTIVASSMTMNTINLEANCPVTTDGFYGYSLTGNNIIESVGVIIRNMEANTRIYLTSGVIVPTYQW